MAEEIIKARVWWKTDTEEGWNNNPLILGPGEPAWVTNENGQGVNVKVGVGNKRFSELEYFVDYAGGQFIEVTTNALPTPETPVAYSFVPEGTYTYPGQPDLVVAPGHWGQTNWNGTTWSLKDMGSLPMQPLDVEGGALSFERGELLQENKAEVSYEGNINLFDKTKYVNDKFFGYYDVGYTYDQIATDAEGWFISQKIPATVGLPYIKTVSAIGFFDATDKMIAAFPNSKQDASVAPVGTVSLRITAPKSLLTEAMVVQGTSINGYDNGVKKLSIDQIPIAVRNEWQNTVIVAKFGGQFETINSALAFLEEKDSLSNRFVILLMPGNYVESVNLVGRYISIYGYDKESTIIRTYTNDYYHPPLDCGGNNNIYNVTVIADDDGQTTPPNGVGNMPAYALHFDTSGRYEHLGTRIQGRAVFKNVNFISHHQHAAGIGMSQDQHLIFEQCEFSSLSSSAFRAHNYMPAGATNQKMTLIDCQIHNPYGLGGNQPIVLQDPNNAAGGMDNVDTVFQFIRNVVWYDDNNSQDLLYVHAPLVPGAISGKILLGRGSFGNNITQLNG